MEVVYHPRITHELFKNFLIYPIPYFLLTVEKLKSVFLLRPVMDLLFSTPVFRFFGLSSFYYLRVILDNTCGVLLTFIP